MAKTSGIVKVLEGMWPKNKAKGLLAQARFMDEINNYSFGQDGCEKILSGCWLLAPKNTEFYKYRFCFFIHPKVIKNGDTITDMKSALGNLYRPFHAVSEFMENAGIGVIYVFLSAPKGRLPISKIKKKEYDSLEWKFFAFRNGKFTPVNPHEFFERWGGDRGRASYGHGWDKNVKKDIKRLDEDVLTEMLVNELFYTGFIKGTLKKPLNDPYDVDSFLVSISQKHIFPMEIKEKFPGERRDGKFFGIDVGRVMMMLRLGIPNDSNSVYLIRELNEDGKFIGWKYVTLSDIIMTSGWNLQAGGPGMGGQSTQTIILPYDYFKDFTEEVITEDNLKKISSLPKDAKVIAKEFGEQLNKIFL